MTRMSECHGLGTRNPDMEVWGGGGGGSRKGASRFLSKRAGDYFHL